MRIASSPILLTAALGLLATTLGCTGSISGDDDAGRDAASIDAPRLDADRDDAGSDGGSDAGPPDPCDGTAFCEDFEGYTEAALTDGQRFGPWRAALRTPGGAMGLDGEHVTSGARALHVSIDGGVTAGGRLFTDGDVPFLADRPTHVYGRMRMFIDPSGASVHWTFFGASGDAEPSSSEVGRRATYLMSSLPRSGVNTFSVVDGLQARDPDPYHDCWFQSMEPMPTAEWACVAFEMDSVARQIRVSIDGGAPIIVLDDHGQGCVGDVVPDDAPWVGPAIDQLYLGAWSFHPMDAPLEVWIDDLVVDTAPVACP